MNEQIEKRSTNIKDIVNQLIEIADLEQSTINSLESVLDVETLVVAPSKVQEAPSNGFTMINVGELLNIVQRRQSETQRLVMQIIGN